MDNQPRRLVMNLPDNHRHNEIVTYPDPPTMNPPNPWKTAFGIAVTAVVTLGFALFYQHGQLNQANQLLYRALNFNINEQFRPVVGVLTELNRGIGLVQTNQVASHNAIMGAVRPSVPRMPALRSETPTPPASTNAEPEKAK